MEGDEGEEEEIVALNAIMIWNVREFNFVIIICLLEEMKMIRLIC